jgi:4-hydroxy-3-methylbut-2-enyl diphosphate reductase IspH
VRATAHGCITSQTEADVCLEWFDAAAVVGVTAGTSTPDDVIDRVEARIRLCGDASAGRVRQSDARAEAPTQSAACLTKGLR